MVREDFPGGRLLSLRRRRSRLPWIYLVYQQAEERRVKEPSGPGGGLETLADSRLCSALPRIDCCRVPLNAAELCHVS